MLISRETITSSCSLACLTCQSSLIYYPSNAVMKGTCENRPCYNVLSTSNPNQQRSLAMAGGESLVQTMLRLRRIQTCRSRLLLSSSTKTRLQRPITSKAWGYTTIELECQSLFTQKVVSRFKRLHGFIK